MEHWRIKPDTFHKFRVENTEYILSPQYDTMHHFPHLGSYLLKVVDDEQGLVGFWLEPEQAHPISELTKIPLVERDFITVSEKASYIEMRDMTFGDIDERLADENLVPEPYEILNDDEIVEIDHDRKD